jgi:Concanavalin A-like lectin/glucanases superfamily
MKRNIILGILSLFFCLGLVGLFGSVNGEAKPAIPGVVTSACPVDSTLKGCWLFEEGSGTSTADGSGNGNTGILVGATWVADRHGTGTALHFNGTSQYVRVADSSSLDITGAITIAAWVKPETVRLQAVVKKAVTSGSRTDGYELSLDSETGGCSINPCAFGRFNEKTSANLFRIDASTTYTITNPWSLYAVTYDPVDNTLRMYRDGVLSNTNTPASPLTIATNDLYLGIGAQLSGTGPTATYLFKGSLDDILIFNRALSATEISALYDLPTAVNVIGIGATSTPKGIKLNWLSVEEADLLGFNIYRSESLDQLPVKINPLQIPGVNPGQITGNGYSYLDTTALPGKAYDYWIEWVGETATQRYGPAPAILMPYWSWLPLGLK